MNVSNLFTYQIEHAKKLAGLLEAGKNCLDGSDCGTGKSATTCAVIRHLNLPTLVITPKIAFPNWEWLSKHFGVEFDLANIELVRTGKTPFGQWENPRIGPLKTELRCTRCQLVVEPGNRVPCIFGGDSGVHCVEVKKLPHNSGRFLWNPGIKFLVLDEAHQVCAQDSLNADMAIAAKRQGIKVLALSATIADSPLGLKALGFILGLHNLVGEHSFFRFAFRYGCHKKIFGGLDFGRGETPEEKESDRKRHMAKLHKEIFPARGSRLRIAELGDAFPACSITAELFDFGDPERINALYSQMDEALTELKECLTNYRDPDHPFTRLLHARRELELIKIPLYEQLAKDEVEAGNTAVLFLAFRSSMDKFCGRLGVNARIEGGQTRDAREAVIQEYLDDKHRILVCNIDTGGTAVNLPDLRGKFPRVGITSLIYSSRKMRQLFGRLRRATSASKSRYRVILAGGTREEKIHRALAGKLNNIDALNDADLLAANLPVSPAEWPESL